MWVGVGRLVGESPRWLIKFNAASLKFNRRIAAPYLYDLCSYKRGGHTSMSRVPP
jgi:hypothetical protein